MRERLAHSGILSPGSGWVTILEAVVAGAARLDEGGACARSIPGTLHRLQLLGLQRTHRRHVGVPGQQAGDERVHITEVLDDDAVDLRPAQKVTVERDDVQLAPERPI